MVGMLSRAAAHQHDALDDVVVVVLAGDAEPRLVADRDSGDVADQHRGAVAHHHMVWRISSIEWIWPTAAHHRRLRADVHGAGRRR